MENTNPSDYGLWSLVIINSLVFIIFAFSFAKPPTPRDWRSFSAFSAFEPARTNKALTSRDKENNH